MFATLPNFLTFMRIAMIPVVMASFYIHTAAGRWVAVIVFVAACLTDYLDGYFARAWSQTTKMGQFLDPVADKLLVASTLLLLAGFGRISHVTMLPTMVILCREILVSGLREYLSDLHITVPVTRVSKFKTAIQMLAISLLLLGDTPAFGSPVLILGEVFMWLAAILTLHSGLCYLKDTRHYFNE
jgi:cardiolipin synthase